MTPPPDADALPSPAIHRTVVVENERGLHARAAARFVKTAGAYEAEVSVRKGTTVVSGLSIMGLMMLAAGPGCELELIVQGRQAREAADALARLVAARFEED